MRLNYLRLDPRPYDFDSEGTKAADILISQILSTMESLPEARLLLSLGGFLLESLHQRGRKGLLRKLAELSTTGRIELLRLPLFEQSPQVSNPDNLEMTLNLQQEFWSEYQARLSQTTDLSGGFHLINDFLSSQDRRGHILIPGSTAVLQPALRRLNSAVMATPLCSRLAVSSRVSIELNLLQLTSLSEKSLSYFLSTLRLPDQVSTAELLSAEPADEAPGIPITTSQQNYLAERLLVLQRQIDETPKLISERLEKAREEKVERIGDETRLAEAQRFLLRAGCAVLDEALNPKAQRSCLEYILRGEVELEAYLHPDVDPTVGWVRIVPQHRGGYLVNTQLTDLFLTQDGAISEFDYKPQKVALIGAFPSRAFEVTPESAPDQRKIHEPKVVRKTLDLVTLRFVEEFNASTQIVREFTFKAGIGAHLPNATTGFSMEYWIEGEKLKEELRLSVTLTAPSASPLMSSFKPLLCVGGVSDRQLPVNEAAEVLTSELPGGLFGLRLLDRLEDLTIDLRSAKQLERLTIEPLDLQGVFQAVTVNFFLSAARIHGDDRSNTVFLSVM